jgi:hypothetical protein
MCGGLELNSSTNRFCFAGSNLFEVANGIFHHFFLRHVHARSQQQGPWINFGFGSYQGQCFVLTRTERQLGRVPFLQFGNVKSLLGNQSKDSSGKRPRRWVQTLSLGHAVWGMHVFTSGFCRTSSARHMSITHVTPETVTEESAMADAKRTCPSTFCFVKSGIMLLRQPSMLTAKCNTCN